MATRNHVRPALIFAIGCGAIGAALGIALAPAQRVTVVSPPEVRTELVPVTIPVPIVHAPAQPLRASELSLVFSAGGATYVKLADIGETGEILPKHGKARLHHEDYTEIAIASVEAKDVPAAHRAWHERTVRVDNTCEAKVTGFAVVSRLRGDTGYANTTDEKWTAKNVLQLGSVVLAARLDGCKGTFARDASLPPVAVPEAVEDERLAALARAALIDSAASRETQREWLEYEQPGNWYEFEHVSFPTRVLRHPTTGATWVSVHGTMAHGCGEAEVNVWGLFRVKPDGTLAAVQLRKLGDLSTIDQLIDIDNDGELELIGKPWLGLDTVVTRASGEELQRLPLAFFGCPC